MSLFPSGSSDVVQAHRVTAEANRLTPLLTEVTPNRLPLGRQNGNRDVLGVFQPKATQHNVPGSLLQLQVNRDGAGGLPQGIHTLFNADTTPPFSTYNGRRLPNHIKIPEHLRRAYDMAESSGRISANLAGPAIAMAGGAAAAGLIALAYPNSFLDKFVRGLKNQIQERLPGDPAAAR